MADYDRFASIADASKPNAGRIYDFALGGNHNFEVDRQAVEQVLKLAPGFQRTVKTIRWFLGEAVRRLLADGFTQFIDFASGLPTVDHIHQIAPKGTKVVYSDIDPITVAYGQEIVRDIPDAIYIACNVTTPEHLLKDPAVLKLIDRSRKTAFGMNGIAYFIKDADIAHAMKVLYDWADKGCRLFISDADTDPSKATESTQDMSSTYQKLGQPIFSRTVETLIDLCRPWSVKAPGFRPLEEWIGMNAGVGEAETAALGSHTVGAILEK
jgi:S-adenosyl methyltransferase